MNYTRALSLSNWAGWEVGRGPWLEGHRWHGGVMEHNRKTNVVMLVVGKKKKRQIFKMSFQAKMTPELQKEGVETFWDMNSGVCPHNWIRTFSGVSVCPVEQQQQVVGPTGSHQQEHVGNIQVRGGACRAAGAEPVEQQEAVRSCFSCVVFPVFPWRSGIWFQNSARTKTSFSKAQNKGRQ